MDMTRIICDFLSLIPAFGIVIGFVSYYFIMKYGRKKVDYEFAQFMYRLTTPKTKQMLRKLES